MSYEFQPSTQAHTCPICEHIKPGKGQHGDCRETPEGMWLCHRFIDGEIRERSHDGKFFYVGSSDKGASWGMWLPIEKMTVKRVPDSWKKRASKREPVVMCAKALAQGVQKRVDEERKDYDENSVSDMRDLFMLLYGNRLGYDLLKQTVTIDGEPISNGLYSRAYEILDDEYGVVTRKTIASDALEAAAHKNEYHPLRRYFLSLHRQHKDGLIEPADLDGLVAKYLQSERSENDALYAAYLRKWLIAFVARQFEPGLKYDAVLLLQGKQGAAKGTFFEVLAGGDRYYTSSVSIPASGEMTNKQLMTLHSFAVAELAEVGERTLGRADAAGGVKAMITATVDSFVPQYGRKSESFPRGFIWCGTVNEEAGFLSDPTGNRRFQIIPTDRSEENPIDFDALKAERDQILLAAYLAYRHGESIWLSKDLIPVAREATSAYAQEVSLEEEAMDWCARQVEFTLRQAYDAIWGLPTGDFERNKNMVGRTLAKIPWVRGGQKLKANKHGKRPNGYKVDHAMRERMISESLPTKVSF